MVDGREIRREEVEKAYRRTAPPSPVPSDDEALTAKLTLLNELILQDILVAKARELKIELTDAELDQAYADGRKDIPEDQFQQELTRRNLTAADMRERLRTDLLVQKVLEREVVSKITVTDQDITEFFNANRAQFSRTEDAYHIAQIVVTPAREPQVVNRSGNDAATPQEAAAKVQMLMERLKAGTPFGELAADFSEDPESAQRGGDLGFVPVSALQRAPPPLRDAALKSEPGTVRVVSHGRRPHHRAGGGARSRRPTRSEHAGCAGTHHRDAARPPGATAARGLPRRDTHRCGGRESHRAAGGRVAVEDARLRACRSGSRWRPPLKGVSGIPRSCALAHRRCERPKLHRSQLDWKASRRAAGSQPWLGGRDCVLSSRQPGGRDGQEGVRGRCHRVCLLRGH